MSSPAMSYPVPTQDEKTMALAACLLSAFTGFLGPLIIFFIKRESLFVKFYALQAILWNIGYSFIIMVAFMVMFFSIVLPAVMTATGHNGPPPAMFVFFPLIWLIAMAGGMANLVLGIISCIKASNGEWWRYPITGRIAERLLRS